MKADGVVLLAADDEIKVPAASYNFDDCDDPFGTKSTKVAMMNSPPAGANPFASSNKVSYPASSSMVTAKHERQ